MQKWKLARLEAIIEEQVTLTILAPSGVTTNSPIKYENLDEKICDLCGDGWELVEIVRITHLGYTGFQYWFKRPMEGEQSKEERK